MTVTAQRVLTAMFAVAMLGGAAGALAQTPASSSASQSPATQSTPSSAVPAAPLDPPSAHPGVAISPLAAAPSNDVQPLVNFRDTDIKFNLGSLMNTLRDARHEGWVLAAYPDPKTSRPLIGAGFSLDVIATQHVQRDPLNPHPFLEPSTPQLWQAAGLDSIKLQGILDQFDRDLDAWKKKKYRKKIRTHEVTQQLTEEEATQLLRISAIQAVYNARAYCRFFDQLTASQQMALSQLVFQMGVNLEEFVQFLGAINSEDADGHDMALPASVMDDPDHWKMVQSTLIQSDWARRYSTRAIAVIAMFDPEYEQDPLAAERKVRVQVHPLVVHHKKRARATSVRAGTHKSTKHPATKG